MQKEKLSISVSQNIASTPYNKLRNLRQIANEKAKFSADNVDKMQIFHNYRFFFVNLVKFSQISGGIQQKTKETESINSQSVRPSVCPSIRNFDSLLICTFVRRIVYSFKVTFM